MSGPDPDVGERRRLTRFLGSSPLATAILIASGLVGVILAVVTTFVSGANWDLKMEVTASQAARAIDPSGLSLDQAYALVNAGLSTGVLYLESYGVLFWRMADGIHSLLGGSGPLQANDPASFVWFGTLSIALSVITACALGYTVARVLRSHWAGALAAALLLVTPLWLGHTTMNFKDTTLAEGLTLVSTGLIQAFLSRNRARGMALGILMAGAGATLVLGVRASSWPLLVAVLLGSLALLGLQALVKRDWSAIGRLAVGGGAALAIAVIITWLTSPFARIGIVDWLVHSFKVAKAFPYLFIVRTNGVDVWSIDIPRWYVPAWLWAQLPLLTSAALVFGLCAYVAALIARDTRWQVFTLSPLLVQGLAIPALIIASRAGLYDSIRHLLFMLPAIAMLVAVGLWYLDRILRVDDTTGLRARLSRVAPSLAVLVVLASLFASVRWMPYNYAFVNPIAAGGDSRRWELDYWGLTAREGIRRAHEAGNERVFLLPNATPGYAFGALEGTDIATLAVPGERYGLYTFMRSDPPIPSGCTEDFRVRRDGLTLGIGYSCVASG